ncbi:uncharacterized protein PGTG_22027 [Puccinia graminis f. sp. tritici CRL 75-36-700-3]|uniref:Uncharacterized protein n=1 Tax=Puccinia graminis f. sp. tritici (strain CRL 75-36-700-3 / race SCCL) TaxID=418459 RepID=H6QTB6_PUCGT|nr:uncharacterized protein PGTG_22027 [Puccinia graminis f. sp. tritici CRL 75-36-700-3]EHS64070.1 hypothetical protein PGTG_22027 [Puccinia graminis f. sp. tritici CRL 75-36-700-3]
MAIQTLCWAKLARGDRNGLCLSASSYRPFKPIFLPTEPESYQVGKAPFRRLSYPPSKRQKSRIIPTSERPSNMESTLRSAPKVTRAKSAKNPVVNNENTSSPSAETETPVNPTITLDASQDSGGDESVDLISKNPVLSTETLNEIASKTSVPPITEQINEREHIWAKIKDAQTAGDEILARALLIAYESMDIQKPNAPARSTSAHPILVTANPGGQPSSVPTETQLEDNLIYAVGAVTSHQDIGFTPYFDENIKKLRAPIPLTIFDKDWQKKALAAHMLLKPAKSSEDKAYRGLAYYDEWTQTHSAWTNNHRSFFITLRDVYNKRLFAEKLLIHKANCDSIADVYGFMTAFRYDMQIRMNAFAHRLPSKDGAAIPDISVKQDIVIEQCYSIVRSHGESGWKDNFYAPGGSHAGFDPDTGLKRPDFSRSNSAPTPYGGRNSFINNNSHFSYSNHQGRRRENNRNRFEGNFNQENPIQHYNYNPGYNYNQHFNAQQQRGNFGHSDHQNQNHHGGHPYHQNNSQGGSQGGGSYSQSGSDSRKRFRSGKADQNERVGGNDVNASNPKP